jgi:calmodulin
VGHIETEKKNKNNLRGGTGTHARMRSPPGSARMSPSRMRPGAHGSSPPKAKPRPKTAEEVFIDKKTQLKDRLAGSLTKMDDLFKKWDVDGNGQIDKGEFRRAVKALGESADDALCDAVFDEYDVDGSGEIEYKEYVRYSLRDALNRSRTRVMDLFRKLDGDASGCVDKTEFRQGVRQIGFDAPVESLDAVFDDMDADGSGSIDFTELNVQLRQGARVTLPPQLQVGAAGKIETSRKKVVIPRRQASPACGSKKPHPSATAVADYPSSQAQVMMERRVAARRLYSEGQRAGSSRRGISLQPTPASRGSSHQPTAAAAQAPIEGPSSGKPVLEGGGGPIDGPPPRRANVAKPAAATPAPPPTSEIERRVLAGGWEEVLDPASGNPYYHHIPTGRVSWNRPPVRGPPAAASAPSCSSAPPPATTRRQAGGGAPDLLDLGWPQHPAAASNLASRVDSPQSQRGERTTTAVTFARLPGEGPEC